MTEDIEDIKNIISKYTKDKVEFSDHFDEIMKIRTYLNKEHIKDQIFDLKNIKWYEDQHEKYKEKRYLLVYYLSSKYDFAIVIVINGKLKVITAYKREIRISDRNRKVSRRFIYKKEDLNN
jgi:hypothetical protein